ncbi:hypothetical protein CF326_g8199 [Tilletia indica]|nr:hypothetical protein CF326_g8199 [Tilletia indica]
MPVQAMCKLTVLECTEALRAELDVEAESKRRRAAENDVSGSEGGGSNGSTTTIEPEKKVMTVGGAAVAVASALSDGATAATLSQQLDDDERARAEAKAGAEEGAGDILSRPLPRTLGGTVWKIRSPLSGTILLALEYNHNRERHLDDTALLASSSAAANAVGALAGTSAGASTGGVLDAVRRADVLGTDISRRLLTNAKRKDKDAASLRLIDRASNSGNSLFFPIGPFARLLELLILFDQHWVYAYTFTAHNSSNNPNINGASSPPKYPLCLISKTDKEMLQRERTFMEWMTREDAGSPAALAAAQAAEEKERNEKRGGGNQRRWGQKRDGAGPLELRYLRVFTSIEAMDEVIPLNTSKVVMVVPPSLTHGPSRRLVQRFADKE